MTPRYSKYRELLLKGNNYIKLHKIPNGSRTFLLGPERADWQKNGIKKSHDTVPLSDFTFYILYSFILWMVSGVRGEVAQSQSRHSVLVLHTVHFQPPPPPPLSLSLSTGAYNTIPFLLFYSPPSPHSSFSFLLLLILYPHLFCCYPISPYFPYPCFLICFNKKKRGEEIGIKIRKIW